MAKTRINKLDPCLPRPQDVLTPAELVLWEKRVRAEGRKGAEDDAAQKSSEKD